MGNRLATADIGRKLGGLCQFGRSWVLTEHNIAWAEAYLCAKWHLDPSSRLATIHHRHRQDRQRSDSRGRANRFTNGGPKHVLNRQVAEAWPLSPLGSLQCSPRPLAGGGPRTSLPLQTLLFGFAISIDPSRVTDGLAPMHSYNLSA